MLRLSATHIEAFRLYLTDQEWMSAQALKDTLCGVSVASPAMQLGHAFHAVLETPERYRRLHDRDVGYITENYTFDQNVIHPVLALIDRSGVFEVKTTKELDGVTLVAQADYLAGATLHEFKTTSYFDAEKYTSSLQWRVMALLFEPSEIRYHVASLDDHGNGVVELRDLNSLTVYPYAALEGEVRQWVRDLVAFIDAQGWREAVENRVRAA